MRRAPCTWAAADHLHWNIRVERRTAQAHVERIARTRRLSLSIDPTSDIALPFQCGSGTNRPCIRAIRPSLRCRRAGRRARSPSCGYPGPQAGAALTALAGKIPSPRVATRALLRDAGGQPIDDAVVLWFPGPASATGEDVAEFHVHGGRAVLAALFAALVGDSKMCARPSPASSPAAHSRTASSISPKPKASTISFMPTPIANAARRCGS